MKLVSTQVEEKDNSKPAVRRTSSTTKPIKKGAHFLVKRTGGDGKDKKYYLNLSTTYMYVVRKKYLQVIFIKVHNVDYLV